LPDEAFYVLIKRNCYYCRASSSNYVRRKGYPNFVYSGVDRLNNKLGYTSKNIVPCCRICNAMKEKLSEQDFLEHIYKIVNFQETRVL
jgi:hypothetical protein